jgi:hypothetical protein
LILDVDGHAYYRFIGLGCQAHQASIISLWVAIGPSPLRTPVVCLPLAVSTYGHYQLFSIRYGCCRMHGMCRTVKVTSAI